MPVNTVSSDVQETALNPAAPQDFRGGVFADKELCMGQQRCNGLNLTQNLRREPVGNP